MRILKNKTRQWAESKWLLGICLNGFDDLKRGHIQWIDNGKYAEEKWFADPFILDYDADTIHLLVEEFDYKVHRGRIAKLTIDRRNWIVIKCKIILDLDTHLSFPMIWREGSEIFVCPENYESGGWNLYRYNESQEKLEFVKRIIDEKLTDAIIWKKENGYWLLSTYEPRPNGHDLTIWRSNVLDGPYIKTQSIQFNENIGRNAGMLFGYGDILIRPAQECNHVYGHSLSFQQVAFLDGKFGFKEIYRFNSPHPVYDVGTHTYNQYMEMAVVDVKGYRHRKIAKILIVLFSFFILLGLKKRPALK